MKTIIETESTLTDRFQTTVPTAVRAALKLNKRDRIHYRIRRDGVVEMSRVPEESADPVLEPFLNLLAKDISKRPEHLRPISESLVNRVAEAVKDMEIDLDAALDTDEQ